MYLGLGTKLHLTDTIPGVEGLAAHSVDFACQWLRNLPHYVGLVLIWSVPVSSCLCHISVFGALSAQLGRLLALKLRSSPAVLSHSLTVHSLCEV